MPLWIDEAIKDYLSTLDQRQMPFKERMALRRKGRTAEHMKRELLYRMLRRDAALANWVEPTRDLSEAELEVFKADFRRRMAPFILPEMAHLPIAFDVDPMTVREFAGAEIKPSVTEFSRTLLREWRSTYLDFPGGSAELDDGWSVRAVFITQETSDLSKWSAILRDGPRSPAMVLTWYVAENVGHIAGSLVGYDEYFSHASSCGRWSEFIADLVYLCTAWFATMSVSDRSGRPAGEGGVALLARDRHTVVSAPAEPPHFRLVKLTPPLAHHSATRRDKPNGAGLARHITVRGHFKLVRWGKQWAHHRLQWVPAYERGPRNKPLETRVPLFRIASLA